MDLKKDEKKREVVFGILRRAQASTNTDQWMIGYYAARDLGAGHDRAMNLADKYVGERSG